MTILYHPRIENMVADALSLMTMGSITHLQDGKIVLLKDVHRLAWLGIKHEDSPK